MLDRFERNISYLRISVTDRCNLRCRYCMPENGIEWMDHRQILTFEEIAEVVKTGVKLGIRRIRLTGGEPLVRKGIVTLVEMLAAIRGIEEVSMTTNGVLLAEFAGDLARAGLKRVNVSLDATDPVRYGEITRGGDVNQVLRGIEAAVAAGLTPVKLNCVVWNSAGEPDARMVAAYAKEKGLKVQFIHQMDLESGEFSLVEGGNGGNCPVCNRLRLTATGDLKPCLFHSSGFNVRLLGIEEAFRQAVNDKPEAGTRNLSGKFYNIGG